MPDNNSNEPTFKQPTSDEHLPPDISDTPPTNSDIDRGTSIGTKLIYVVITAILSLIPLFGVLGVLDQRDRYAERQISNLEANLGGRQELFGPVIVVPVAWVDNTLDTDEPSPDIEKPKRNPPQPMYLTPEDLRLDVGLITKRAEASLYGAIGYDAEIKIDAGFLPLEQLIENSYYEYSDPVIYQWDNARAVVYLSNTASTKVRPVLKVGGQALAFAPGIPPWIVSQGNRTRRGSQGGATGYSASIGQFIDPSIAVAMNTSLAFKGATFFTAAPVGANTTLEFAANVPPNSLNAFDPESTAVFQPENSEEYSTTSSSAGPYASGSAGQFQKDIYSSLLSKQNFVVHYDAENVRPYSDIRQALQYGFFLMGFSFLTFFVFDALSKRYLHAAQYFLLGLVQTVFYALLLAIAEFTGFEWGFLFAAVPTILVTGLSVSSILRSPVMGIFAIVIFSAFYAVQYILMDMAQYALLVAAGAGFVAVAATLIATSRLEWGKFQKNA